MTLGCPGTTIHLSIEEKKKLKMLCRKKGYAAGIKARSQVNLQAEKSGLIPVADEIGMSAQSLYWAVREEAGINTTYAGAFWQRAVFVVDITIS